MNNRTRLIKIGCFILLTFLFIHFSTLEVHADMGPKPSIKVQVVNGPLDYYTALLREQSERVDTNSELTLDVVDDETVHDYLEDFYYDGWVYHKSPVGGNCFKSNLENEYKYGYMVPDVVRVILISSDGTVYLSDSLDVREFDASITYDVKAGTLTEKLDTFKPVRRAILMLTCLVLTLGLEFIILLLFRYPLTKNNIIWFFAINVLTNIPFTFALLIGLFDRASIVMMVIPIFMEVIITIVESVFYIFTLKDKSGEKKRVKNFFYVVVANIFSALMGDVIVYVFWMISNLIRMRNI